MSEPPRLKPIRHQLGIQYVSEINGQGANVLWHSRSNTQDSNCGEENYLRLLHSTACVYHSLRFCFSFFFFYIFIAFWIAPPYDLVHIFRAAQNEVIWHWRYMMLFWNTIQKTRPATISGAFCFLQDPAVLCLDISLSPVIKQEQKENETRTGTAASSHSVHGWFPAVFPLTLNKKSAGQF